MNIATPKRALSLTISIIILLFFEQLLFAQIPFDEQRYISIEDIKPGMTGYALSVYRGTDVEKFPIKVISVVKNNKIGKNAIFVMGTDPRFIHTGPVEGCSGSPVYIDGKIAGALAFGWNYSKDPLYGVTPIAEMIKVGQEGELNRKTRKTQNHKFDYSGVITQEKAYQSFIDLAANNPKNSSNNGLKKLRCPLITSLPANACAELSRFEDILGFDLISNIAPLPTSNVVVAPNFEPGSVLAVPLVDGDIKMAAIGTVTDVVDDHVFGFGHSFMGQGRVNLPMATGYIHTVVANSISSFKYGQTCQVVGALLGDESTAVYGKIGEIAPTIPLSMKLRRFNSDEEKEYNCKIAVDDTYTPILIQSVIAGIINSKGDLPVLHNLKYSARITYDKDGSLEFDNISANYGAYELMRDVVGNILLLRDNPYHKAKITSIDIDVELDDCDKMATIWQAQLSGTKFKAGELIEANVTTEGFMSQKRQYSFQLTIPENTAPGNYQLMLSGTDAYLESKINSMPYLFTADNFTNMIKIMKSLSNNRNDKLYCSLILPDNGISIETSGLKDLPASKQAVLISPSRSMQVRPISKWITTKQNCGNVVNGMREFEIEVIE